MSLVSGSRGSRFTRLSGLPRALQNLRLVCSLSPRRRPGVPVAQCSCGCAGPLHEVKTEAFLRTALCRSARLAGCPLEQGTVLAAGGRVGPAGVRKERATRSVEVYRRDHQDQTSGGCLVGG